MDDELGALLSRLGGQTDPSAGRFDAGAELAGELVVLPSAFNPPTLAHQHLLERATQAVANGRPTAMLTTRNVDKGVHGASLEQRVEMLLAVQRDWPELAVVVSNQARIIDQAESLRSSFGDGLRLSFVVGFDTLERLFARRYYANMETELTPFFEHSHVLAANRAEVGVDRVREWVAANAGPFASGITVLEIDEVPAAMSSTAAREKAIAGDGKMVPEVVLRYIEEHGVYR